MKSVKVTLDTGRNVSADMTPTRPSVSGRMTLTVTTGPGYLLDSIEATDENGKSGRRLDPPGTASRAEVPQILMDFRQIIAK